ncbi:hypothetical protein AUP68_11745 [Ilyonectria robusta]
MIAQDSSRWANQLGMGTTRSPTDYLTAAPCTAITSKAIVGVDYASSCLPSALNSVCYSPGWNDPRATQHPCLASGLISIDATAFTVPWCPTSGDLVLTQREISEYAGQRDPAVLHLERRLP